VTAARSSERLGRAFFDRPTVVVARALLGAELEVRGRGGPARRARIVETEAYVRNDAASHAARGPTHRNRSMFGPAGTLYVYRIHQVVCANLVTRPGEAALLRAAEPLVPGLASTTGPGRLCAALGLTLADDGTDTTRSPRVRVYPRVGGIGPIGVGVRVGLRKAAERPLRFGLLRSRWVSRPRGLAPRPSV
jgi:DNA-3-methyladenine glycosylase